MTKTSSLEVSIKIHIDCTLNICSMLVCILIAPSVNILCIFTVVHMVAFVNLMLEKMMNECMNFINKTRIFPLN